MWMEYSVKCLFIGIRFDYDLFGYKDFEYLFSFHIRKILKMRQETLSGRNERKKIFLNSSLLNYPRRTFKYIPCFFVIPQAAIDNM